MRAVTLRVKCQVKLIVARLEIGSRVDAKRFLGRVEVHPCVQPYHLLVTQLAVLLPIALHTDIVGIQPRFFRRISDNQAERKCSSA